MKRSRSSSLGNIRVLNPPPTTALAFQWNPRANPSVISVHATPPKVWEMARVGILTVSAPKFAVRNGQGSHFLDRCFFCKKRLRQDDERFMYGFSGCCAVCA